MHYLKQHQWLYSELGSGNEAINGAQALSWQDAFIRYIPLLNTQKTPSSPPIGMLHLYYLEHPTILLGPKDVRLPQLKTGLQYLEAEGYTYHLRAHGGLAVVSDPGVLNISFISDNLYYPLSIDQAYEQMVHWVRLALAKLNLSVDSYEVPDSYCPGTYDIVVNNKKVGGIAQRRFKSGVATAAYISVNGNQNKRAELIREFYYRSKADTHYPMVNKEVMASLNEFTTQHLSIDEFKELLVQVIESQSRLQTLDAIHPELLTTYQKMFRKAQERNHSLIIERS